MNRTFGKKATFIYLRLCPKTKWLLGQSFLVVLSLMEYYIHKGLISVAQIELLLDQSFLVVLSVMEY